MARTCARRRGEPTAAGMMTGSGDVGKGWGGALVDPKRRVSRRDGRIAAVRLRNVRRQPSDPNGGDGDPPVPCFFVPLINRLSRASFEGQVPPFRHSPSVPSREHGENGEDKGRIGSTLSTASVHASDCKTNAMPESENHSAQLTLRVAMYDAFRYSKIAGHSDSRCLSNYLNHCFITFCVR